MQRFAWLGLALVASLPATALAAPPDDAAMGDGLRAEGFNLSPPPSAATVCAAGTTLHGIDVSKWQGTIDWNAVANDGVIYAFVRVSDGLNFPDEFFETNLAASRAQGIHTGVYQFFRPSQDAVAQADMLIARMPTLEPGDLPPVIDMEDTGGLSPAAVTAAMQQWIDRVEGHYGVAPIIYSGKYFWQDNVQSAAYSSYPLWIAHYTSNCPNIADQWSDWAFHQFTDSGSTAGVPGPVDTNEFNGDLATLLDLTVGGGGVCGDSTCNSGETPSNCIQDCPPCAWIPPAGLDIDDAHACFVGGGDPMFWRQETSGFDGGHQWTYATAAATPSNYARWDMFFEQAGDYRVSAYVEASAGGTTQASYELMHAGTSSLIQVDQSSASGWVDLGEFNFAADGDQWLRLNDNTGESWDLQLRLVADAVRIEPTGTGGTTSSTSSSSTGSSSSTTDASTSAASTTTAAEATTADSDVGTGDATSASTDEGDDDKGCGCTSGSSPLSALFLLPMLAWRRRRNSPPKLGTEHRP